MKRLLGGSDIKENCQIESCFDLYHCTRVGSREQTVNLLANSPSVVRVHAMVNLNGSVARVWQRHLLCKQTNSGFDSHQIHQFERRIQQT